MSIVSNIVRSIVGNIRGLVVVTPPSETTAAVLWSDGNAVLWSDGSVMEWSTP